MAEQFDFSKMTQPEMTAAIDRELARIAERDGAPALCSALTASVHVASGPSSLHVEFNGRPLTGLETYRVAFRLAEVLGLAVKGRDVRLGCRLTASVSGDPAASLGWIGETIAREYRRALDHPTAVADERKG